MWTDHFDWAKDVNIFVSHKKAHQKVTLSEREFNNQVDGVTVLWKPLCLAIFVFAMNSVYAGRDGSRMWARQHGFPLTKAGLATAAAECWLCQQHRLTLSPRCSIIPQGDQPATW